MKTKTRTNNARPSLALWCPTRSRLRAFWEPPCPTQSSTPSTLTATMSHSVPDPQHHDGHNVPLSPRPQNPDGHSVPFSPRRPPPVLSELPSRTPAPWQPRCPTQSPMPSTLTAIVSHSVLSCNCSGPKGMLSPFNLKDTNIFSSQWCVKYNWSSAMVLIYSISALLHHN